MNPQTDQTAAVPSAPASEAAYLGALLAGHIGAGELYLEPTEFREMRNEHIYRAASNRLMYGQPLDAALLADDLTGQNTLNLVGGIAYLNDLTLQGMAVTAAHADEHARVIRAKAVQYSLGQAAQQAAGAAPEQAIKILRDAAENAETRIRGGQPVRYSWDTAIDEQLGSIQWLWKPWILRGFVTTLVAPQECGKSNVALDLCGRITRGAAWPDQQPTGIKSDDARLLWIDTEMALAALAERMNAWGLPRDTFVLPEDPLRLLQLDRETDLRWIEATVAKFRPPIIVIDALSGGHRSEEKDNDQMKLIMQWLSQLAQTYKIAVLAIHHLRKASVGEPDFPISLDRVRGASAITQFSRVVLGLGIPDKSKPESRRMEVIKSNFGPKPAPLGYEITGTGLAWGDAPEAPKVQRAIEAARDFLLDALRNGPKESAALGKQAEAEGVCSYNTLKAAKQELGIRAIKNPGAGGQWFWALPGKESYKQDPTE